MDGFQQRLSNWGLIHLWTAAEAKNAKNCCERKHGVPFYRLARLGFMADPTPKDLGGILNCNALYSFTTGIIQLLFGSILMYEQGFMFQIIVPLSISGTSLALSVLNIYYNFSAVCMQIEGETRLADRILQRAAGQLEDGKRKLTEERDQQLAEIENRFGGKTYAPSIVKKGEASENA